MNRVTFFFLLVCFFVAFFLRWYLLPTHLFFGPEQGRDFLAIRNIVVSHTLTLIGPKTDIAGIFHGPLYYYVAAIPFLPFGGNPLSIAGTFAILQALTVFFAYGAGKEISGKRSIGLLSAILFTFSYGAIVYSRWLTGVPLSIPLAFAFLWLLFRFLHGHKSILPAVAVVGALLLQAEFINFLFVPVILLYVVIRYFEHVRKTPRLFLAYCALIFLFLATGTYVLFDVRHNFLMTRSVLNLFEATGQSTASWSSSFRDVSAGFVEAVGGFIGIPIFWISAVFLLGVTAYLVLRSIQGGREEAVLLVWLMVPPIMLVLFRRGMLEQLFVLTMPAFLVGAALVVREIVHRFGRTLAILMLIAIVVINVWQVWRNFPTNDHVFFQSTQPAVRYGDQVKIIDQIYTRAGGRSFEIQAYTIPYFWQDAWTYLFWYKGKDKGHLPVERGGEMMFVIIQKDRSNSTFQNNWYRDTVTGWGTLVDQFVVGEYTIEERLLKE